LVRGETVADQSRRVAADGPSTEMPGEMPARDAENASDNSTGLDTKSLPPNGGRSLRPPATPLTVEGEVDPNTSAAGWTRATVW
jgi:hypothetical protein